jgi:hypothetical protein
MDAHNSLLKNAIRQHLEGNVFFTGFVPQSTVPPASRPLPKSSETPFADRVEKYNSLVTSVCACRKCKLHETRTQAVPGEGNEAPT